MTSERNWTRVHSVWYYNRDLELSCDWCEVAYGQINAVYKMCGVFVLFYLTGRHNAPLTDTFPDPAGCDFLGLAVLFRFSHSVCGWGSIIVRYEVSIICHEVPPQFVKVLDWNRQEQLHPAEDVQQCLQAKAQPVRKHPQALLSLNIWAACSCLILSHFKLLSIYLQ